MSRKGPSLTPLPARTDNAVAEVSLLPGVPVSRKFRDLREYIAFLEARGDLRRVSTPVSPHLEITEITACSCI